MIVMTCIPRFIMTIAMGINFAIPGFFSAFRHPSRLHQDQVTNMIHSVSDTLPYLISGVIVGILLCEGIHWIQKSSGKKNWSWAFYLIPVVLLLILLIFVLL